MRALLLGCTVEAQPPRMPSLASTAGLSPIVDKTPVRGLASVSRRENKEKIRESREFRALAVVNRTIAVVARESKHADGVSGHGQLAV